jgi:hypothetical protein
MKFKISTTGSFYSNKDDISRLEKIGFSFNDIQSEHGFYIKGKPIIEINTIEELLNFTAIHGEVIISDDSIEIFDDYRG